MTKLLDVIADARTPKEALRSVRDWLEDAGQPVSAMLLHREGTDSADIRGFFFGEDALEREYDRGYEEGFTEGRAEAEKEAIAILEETKP